jgi:hypothetical protein
VEGVTRPRSVNRFNVEGWHMVLAFVVLPINAVRAPSPRDKGSDAIEGGQRFAGIVLAAELAGKLLRGDQVVYLIVEFHRTIMNEACVEHARYAEAPRFLNQLYR